MTTAIALTLRRVRGPVVFRQVEALESTALTHC